MNKESTTTYTVKSKNDAHVWLFEYRLNGDLSAFKILEGSLTTKQMKWLFSGSNFPATEEMMRKIWMKNLKGNFEIIVGEPDLSFEAFWKQYNHKVKKVVSERAWNRLSRKDKIEALKAIKSYDGYLHRKGIAKAHPATYLNQRYWEDSFSSVH